LKAEKEILPFVTVLMPVRNEASFIARSLGSVMAQEYAPDLMEVLVIDGMSTDGTRDEVRSFCTKYPNLQLLDNPGMIVPTGLNIGLAHARGDVIVRVDGHCEIAPDYVSRCVEHLGNAGADCVGGPIETIGESPTSQTVALAMSSPFGVGGSAFRTVNDRAMLVDTVAFPGYTRQAIDKAGLFDEELVRNQDDEYNYRLRELGGQILLSPDIRSRYYSRSSVRSLWRQYFQYGFWKVRVMQKHMRQMRPRQFVPVTFVIALLSSLLLSPFHTLARWSFVFVVGTYVLANLAASAKTIRGQDWRMMPLLAICFATLHLSYGLGFLFGLARFWNRWGKHESENLQPRFES
jgi:succinoglycan biosynthesis protein ExoA